MNGTRHIAIAAATLAALAAAGCGAAHVTPAASQHSASAAASGGFAAPVTPAPAPAPSPNGTYTGSCDYLLGNSPATGTAVAVGEIDLVNTGNIGTVDRVRITWPQEGYAPITAARTVRTAAGATRPVSFRYPLTYNQISALQSWQTGHNYQDGCTYKATITSTYGIAR